MKKLEKHLKLTCSHCFSTYQLLEIHEQESTNCEANCQAQWEAFLSQTFQDHIMLHLAKQEAEKEDNHD